MKTKIFLLLVIFALLGLTFGAFAQNQLIDSCSIDPTHEVDFGSRQWIDIDFTNQPPTNGWVVVLISSDSLFTTNVDTIFEFGYNYFLIFAPQTIDGMRRAKFNLPDNYPTLDFYLCVNSRINSFARGRFGTSSTSLPTLTPSIPNHTRTYYTLGGQLTTDPHGIVIETTPTTRRLVYLP